MYSIFSRSSEAFASELLENIGDVLHAHDNPQPYYSVLLIFMSYKCFFTHRKCAYKMVS